MAFLNSSRFFELARLVLTLILLAALAIAATPQQSRSGATVRITTVDESEKPVPAVNVELRQNGAVVGRATTNEKGQAEFPNVAAGTYEVVVAKEGLETLNQ